MRKQLLISAGFCLCVLGVLLWRLEIIHAQGVSNVSTNWPGPPQADVDSDGDGFSDLQEVLWGTDPHNANSHPDLLTGMAAWWPLDEGSGTQVSDVSGQGQNATLVGSPLPTWVTDSSGTALSFSGATSRVRATDTGGLTFTNSLSIVAWVKLTATTNGVLVCKTTAESQITSYALSIHQGIVSAQLALSDRSYSLYGHAPIVDGQWHHLALVYDGIAYRLYVDGKRDVGTHIGGTIADASGTLTIGQTGGSFRDVGVFHRAFKDAEIQLLYETVSTAGSGSLLAQRRPSPPAFLYAGAKAHTPVQSVRAESPKEPAP